MAKMTIDELRAQFNDTSKNNENTSSSTLNDWYPFFSMKNGQRAIVRFLPDRNSNNARGFLVEKTFHTLLINGKKRNVPCLSMYDEECPICKVSSAFYKNKDDINGKRYWRKKQYIAQALIVEDPLPPDETTGEKRNGTVKFLALGYQLYNIIKEAFASQEDPLESIPYDFENGYDFIIKKTDQGEYSTYTLGTKFLSKQRSLTTEELAVVDEDMVDLSTLLPKNPGLEKIQAMLDADLNGDTYSDRATETDGEDDSESFVPAKTQPKVTPKPSIKDDEEDLPFTPTKVTPAQTTSSSDDEEVSSDVDEMLKTIRARRKALGK